MCLILLKKELCNLFHSEIYALSVSQGVHTFVCTCKRKCTFYLLEELCVKLALGLRQLVLLQCMHSIFTSHLYGTTHFVLLCLPNIYFLVRYISCSVTYL
jgi:hypothetical protein